MQVAYILNTEDLLCEDLRIIAEEQMSQKEQHTFISLFRNLFIVSFSGN